MCKFFALLFNFVSTINNCMARVHIVKSHNRDQVLLRRFVLVDMDIHMVVAFADKLASDIANSIVLPSRVHF